MIDYGIDYEDSELGRINSRFDQVLDGKFALPILIIQAIRAILEQHNLTLPILEIDPEEDEFIFKIIRHDLEDLYLYIAIDRDDRGHYDGYAQIVDEDELNALEDMDMDTDELEDNEIESSWFKQQRHTGNI
jgi:hypothetical protein